MCTVLLPPCVSPIAVNKYIISYFRHSTLQTIFLNGNLPEVRISVYPHSKKKLQNYIQTHTHTHLCLKKQIISKKQENVQQNKWGICYVIYQARITSYEFLQVCAQRLGLSLNCVLKRMQITIDMIIYIYIYIYIYIFYIWPKKNKLLNQWDNTTYLVINRNLCCLEPFYSIYRTVSW
jgi:hypothetical protein